MKRFALFLIAGMTVFLVNCGKNEELSKGFYGGPATNIANAGDVKKMTIALTSTANPVEGSYTFAGGSINDSGKVTGTVLGLILNLTLKPDAAGVTYTFSGSLGDEDSTIKGTMKGVEAGKTVTYSVDLKK